MSRFCALLISLFLIMGASAAGGLETRLSGFVTGTAFSDTRFHPDTWSAALNIDATWDDFAVRAQFAAPYPQPVRRAVLEYAALVGLRHDVVIQAGRFPRLDSFYNSVTDAPGTWGMAMLPLGEYNRRMIGNRTFSGIDGVQAITTHHLGGGLARLHADTGKMTVENQCDTQMEATKLPCRGGYEIAGVRGNADFGAEYGRGDWTLMGWHGLIRAETRLLDPADRISTLLATRASRIAYSATKLGIRYSPGAWLAQAEIMRTQFQLAQPGRGFTTVQVANTLYVLGGYCFQEALCSYASWSKGISDTPGSGAMASAAGLTTVLDDTTLSVEYNRGQGKSWMRYEATADRWASWVTSITWRY